MNEIVPTVVWFSEDENTTDGSYGEAIRDRLLSEAMRLPFFATFMPITTRGRPIEPADLPILGCYIGEETMIPDGAGNADGLKFICTLRLGWSIMVKESVKEKAEQQLERAYVALLYGLWCNPYLTSMGDTLDPDTGVATKYNARFESIPRQSAVTQWGAFLLNNETPVAEKRWDATFQYRRTFPPRLIHDLLEINIKTSFPSWRTPAEREAIQQVIQSITFTPATPLK